MKKLLLLLTLFSCGKFFAQSLNVIPAVKDFKMGKGSFSVNEKTSIKFKDSFKPEAEAFMLMVKNIYGITLTKNDNASENVIEIENQLPIDVKPAGNDFYRADITDKKIFIGGVNNQGTFRGMMTVLQLMNSKKNEVPCCNISDQEKNYQWRGMHLDVSRHFFPKDFIKKYIDLLAIYKMNTFHWHLTD
ncbi:MAG: family 20 glycosylhydrolase, partial [Bacteroidia bacterium]|nr:family 20 glycosylhydrolase [Bacteroidia bacterium]